MGGSGSTRWWGRSRRATVEESLRFGVKALRAVHAKPSAMGLEFRWTREEETTAEVAVELGATTKWESPMYGFPKVCNPGPSFLERSLSFRYGITRGG